MTETIPSTDLFWIVDSRTGARKLLDVEALEIVRVEKTVAVEAVRAEPAGARPARPEPAKPAAARREPAKPAAARREPARAESAHVDKVARTERLAAPRAARREPHVVWFSNA
ncbi:hypothetical protein [Arthrobacter humicola]